jgi:heterodisulfide reductase subunit C
VEKIEAKNLDPQFKYDVAAQPGGENIQLCFACGTCTAGCPVAGVDKDFDPRRIIRQVLLGMRKQVLGSEEIWKCVQCYCCTAKCPQNVMFRNVARALREMAVAEGYVEADLPGEVEKLDEFSQKIRREMVNALLSDREKFKRIKNKVEESINA